MSWFVGAQDNWSLEISSSVELHTLKLTNKAEKNSRALRGANIRLLQGGKSVKEVKSDARGDFSILVPPDGEFIIEISYPECNVKKFMVSTKDVPGNYDKEGWEPTFPIGGVIMAKPLYSIDYSALKQPMARIFFKQRKKVFDDDEDYTDGVLEKLKQIKANEDELIARFLEAVQTGDAALKIPDCPLAKAMYEKALKLIPDEEYPIAQLAKVGECLKEKEAKEKELAEKAAQEAARKKEEAERVARELEKKQAAEKAELEARAKEERLAREQAEAETKKRAEAGRLAEEKAKAEQLAKEAAERESRQQAEKIARQNEMKLAAERAAQEAKEKEEQLAREKAEAEEQEKAEADRIAKEKNAERLAKEKENQEREHAARLAKEKSEAQTKQKELAERAAREKTEAAAKKRAEEKRVLAEKAEAEKLAREKTEADRKAEAEKKQ